MIFDNREALAISDRFYESFITPFLLIFLLSPLPNFRPKEIILPPDHVIPSSGCIILPSGCLDLWSTVSLRQDNAPLR